MMRAVCLGLALIAPPLWAEGLPALHSVTGVAAGDVLNIRAQPEAGAAIIGMLPPDAAGVEVVGQDGNWGIVNTGEGRGYVSLRFLERDPGPPWYALETGLTCFGTEPFWSVVLEPGAGTISFSTMDAPEPATYPVATLWPGAEWAPSAAFDLPEGLAVLRPEACGDGMSDRAYGIAFDLFGTGGGRLSGCCSLALP